jgi:hypothetical protein
MQRPANRPLIRRAATLAIGTLAIAAAGDARACPVCFGWTEGQGRAGYYWSLLLLSGLPFVAATVVGIWVRRLARRSAVTAVAPGDGDGGRPAIG